MTEVSDKVAERRAEKAQRTVDNRTTTFTKRAKDARTGRQHLVIATNYALAVGKSMNDADRRKLALAISRVVEEMQKPTVPEGTQAMREGKNDGYCQ